jgi:integrase
VRAYSALLGFEIGAHALRATAATNALDHQADVAKVQEWLGHANINTTRASTITAARGRKTARRSRSPIEVRRSSRHARQRGINGHEHNAQALP